MAKRSTPKARQPRAEAVAAPLPLAHEVETQSLNRETPFVFELTPDTAMRDKIAAFLRIEAVPALNFAGEIAARGERGWLVAGEIRAETVQSCVVTLDPVAQSIDERVSRHFEPEETLGDQHDLTVDFDDDDAPDGFSDRIDLAAVMIEELALALDPYPRKQDAALETQVFTEPGQRPMTDEDARPFAKLAALKDKLGGSS